MKNPYEILGLSQEATEADITQGFNRALMHNMKSKQYTPAELMAARKQLLTPARRLVADLVYPARPKAKRPRKMNWPALQEVNLDLLSNDAYDSL